MDITFNCDQCGQHIVVDEAGAGMVAPCPKCGKVLVVPGRAIQPTEDAAASPARTGLSEEKKCPFCAETIKAEAKVCRFCGYDLATGKPSRKATESAQSMGESPLVKILAVIVLIAIMGGGFFAYNFWNSQQKAEAKAKREAPFFVAAKEALDAAQMVEEAARHRDNYDSFCEKLNTLAVRAIP